MFKPELGTGCFSFFVVEFDLHLEDAALVTELGQSKQWTLTETKEAVQRDIGVKCLPKEASRREVRKLRERSENVANSPGAVSADPVIRRAFGEQDIPPSCDRILVHLDHLIDQLAGVPGECGVELSPADESGLELVE